MLSKTVSGSLLISGCCALQFCLSCLDPFFPGCYRTNVVFMGSSGFQLHKIQRHPVIKCLQMIWRVCLLVFWTLIYLRSHIPLQSGHIAWCWGEDCLILKIFRFIARKNGSHFMAGLPLRLEPLQLRKNCRLLHVKTKPVMLAIVVTRFNRRFLQVIQDVGFLTLGINS